MFKQHFSFKVAGLSYYDHDDINPKGDLTADLIPEPDNKYDPNAIRVYVKGKHIGYVPQKKTVKVKSILPTVYEIDAYVELNEEDWEYVEITIWYKK